MEDQVENPKQSLNKSLQEKFKVRRQAAERNHSNYYLHWLKENLGITSENIQLIEEKLENIIKGINTSYEAEDWHTVVQYLTPIQIQNTHVEGLFSFLNVTGKWRQAIDILEKGIISAERTGNVARKSDLLIRLGMTYINLGDYEKAEDILQKNHKSNPKFDSLFHLGTIAMRKGQSTKAETLLVQALQGFNSAQDSVSISSALNQLGNLYMYQGKIEEAKKVFLDSLEIREQNGDLQGIARSLNNLGSMFYTKGQPDTAKDYYAKSLKVSHEINDIYGILGTSGNVIRLMAETGSHESAIELGNKVLPMAQRVGDLQSEARLFLVIGVAYQKAGTYEEANKALMSGLSLQRQLEDYHTVSRSLIQLGIGYFEQNEIDKAGLYLREGLDVAKSYNFIQEMTVANQYLANLAIKDPESTIKEIVMHNAELGSALEKLNMEEASSDFNTYYYSGFQALSREDTSTAKIMFSKALDILDKEGSAPEHKISILNVMASFVESPQEQISLYKKSIDLGTQSSNKRLHAINICALGAIYYGINDFEKAEDYLLEGLQVFENNSIVDSSIPAAIAKIALIKFNNGDTDAASDYYRKGISYFNQAPKDKVSGESIYFGLGTILQRQGNFTEAKVQILKSLELARDLNRPEFIISNLSSIVSILLNSQEFQEAKDYLTELINIKTTMQDHSDFANLYNVLALLSISNKKEALQLASQSMRFAAIERNNEIYLKSYNIIFSVVPKYVQDLIKDLELSRYDVLRIIKEDISLCITDDTEEIDYEEIKEKVRLLLESK